jgi:hypothetical protein
MTTSDYLMLAFCLLMGFNAAALFRFWRMMRLMNFTLRNFIEGNRMFLEALVAESKRRQSKKVGL